MKNKEKKNRFSEIFSENGVLSSKRVLGSIMILASLGCIIYLVIREGGTSIVENLLQTILVLAAGLLGITSVTSIWKHKDDNHNME